MLELIGLTVSYAAVGLAILAAGFYVLDLLTPGKLGHQVMDGNQNAALLAASSLISLGLVLWFAIFFTGAGWDGLDNAAVFGALGVIVQAVGFAVLDVVTPGRLGDICRGKELHPATKVAAAIHVATALVISASLT